MSAMNVISQKPAEHRVSAERCSWKTVGNAPVVGHGLTPIRLPQPAHHSTMCHTVMAHRVTSHSGWSRKQATPVPIWPSNLLSGVTSSKQYRPTYTVPTYLHPPTHAGYNNYGYVLSFHNPTDHLTLWNYIGLLWINITRYNFTANIHTSSTAHTKNLHSSRCKLGMYISHQTHICSKIRSVYMRQPSRATSFKG